MIIVANDDEAKKSCKHINVISANGSQPIERGGANTKSYADDSAHVIAIVPFKRSALCQMLGQTMPAKSVPNPECRWLGTYRNSSSSRRRSIMPKNDDNNDDELLQLLLMLHSAIASPPARGCPLIGPRGNPRCACAAFDAEPVRVLVSRHLVAYFSPQDEAGRLIFARAGGWRATSESVRSETARNLPLGNLDAPH
ncbi:hypothetical protein niasHS_001974 [Heterodera schachtii]|uniref:Uncharacterized protein n=1 Tax=Heterodera schachtii TaxID=97005 RepID=A0ABD2K5Z3_HETSC